MKSTSRSQLWNVPAALSIAVGLAVTQPAAAAPSPTLEPAYIPMVLERDGQATSDALDRLAQSVRNSSRGSNPQIVVLIHGFDTSLKEGEKDYQKISAGLQRHANAPGLPFTVIGIHWHSEVGEKGEWMSRAVAHRVTSLLGLKNAVKNPYLETWKLARKVGRTGARAVFFRLQDEFPGGAFHVLAHSMGSEVVVSALAPELSRCRATQSAEIEQPARELRLDVVTLAGADVDHDVFEKKPAVLDRARKWWITMPTPDHADAALELRRAAGRPDALGNRGITLAPQRLARLQAQGALVLDVGNVPTGHAFGDYYNSLRLSALAAALTATPRENTTVVQGEVVPSG